jgi:DNA repair exonuclease SbcCD ATPase subunit
MESGQSATEEVWLRAHNIGGISRAEVALDPGVTVLAGENATNRTSLLRAAMLALGSDRGSLKGDAEAGRVELTIDGETYTRRLERTADGVRLDGDAYLEEATTAELFAFLLGDNEARQAVQRGADLRELIVRPVDTEALRAEIRELEAEREQIDERVSAIAEREERLPELRRRRAELEEEIRAEQEALAAAERELAALDGRTDDDGADEGTGTGTGADPNGELAEKLDRLRETRTEIERVRERVTTENRSIESLEDEREEVSRELSSLEEPPEAVDRELERLRGRQESLEGVVGELQSVIRFNEQLLEEDRAELRAALDGDDGAGGEPTDRLVGTTTCWTCGSEVERDRIEGTLERLRSFREEKLSELRSAEERIEELQAEQRAAEQARQRRRQLERRLEGIDEETDRRRDRREELRERREELESELERLENEVDRLQEREQSRVLEHHREANAHEFEIGRLRSELERVTEEIDAIDEKLEKRESLRERREQVQSELVDARTRIERLERAAVERFNEQMESVLELLEYGNVERVWIERVEAGRGRGDRPGHRVGPRTGPGTDDGEAGFRLHVVRTGEEGTAYEDTVEHLSESEREVTGLVFALAGYLVHDVHEQLPFVLLDSLEAIDADRIAALVEHVAAHAEYTVAALLPEDAAAVDADRRVEFD